MCWDAEKNKSADLEKERCPVGLPAGVHIEGVSKGKRGSWWITVAHFSELSSRYDNTQRCLLLLAHWREGGVRGNRRHTRTHVGQLIRSLKVIKIHEKKNPWWKNVKKVIICRALQSSCFYWGINRTVSKTIISIILTFSFKSSLKLNLQWCKVL